MQTIERTNEQDKIKKAKTSKLINCQNCHKEFRRTRISNVFCSENCYYTSGIMVGRQKKQRIVTKCLTCDKELLLLPCRVRARNYCSDLCNRAGRKIVATQKPCLMCRKVMNLTSGQTHQRYCSINCSTKSARKKNMNARAKLSEMQVKAIRREVLNFRNTDCHGRAAFLNTFAERYKVSSTTIRRIVLNTTWFDEDYAPPVFNWSSDVIVSPNQSIKKENFFKRFSNALQNVFRKTS